ncbi:hypothetical protein CTEN210_00587 [Chaetoceros tenuissimus]|uniref:SnoaL-like domain-containing protein n=1 Tax=Chaetoceros tenuissimus TaxID=426638 RepID=A0AAD3CEF2_9STRA|nr:hypothetical protein CTEN210_00587 [Chaetoceros tenuissimus]
MLDSKAQIENPQAEVSPTKTCKEDNLDAAALKNAKEVIEVLDSAGDWATIESLVAKDATFTCQAEALADVKTVKEWYDWMVNFKGNIAPDGRCTIKSIAWDATNRKCLFYAVYHATHTGDGGPMPATNKHTDTDYVYEVVMNDEDKVASMTKIWNDMYCLKELGWA